MRIRTSGIRNRRDEMGDPFGAGHPDPAPAASKATEKQINFLKSLAAERDVQLPDLENLTKREASTLISSLLGMPKVRKPAADPEISEGIYRNPETGEIFKVQRAVHGSGRLYAKKLIVEDHGTGYFARGSEVSVEIKPEWRMSLEDAKQFGAIYGVCCVCSRTLTNEASIEAGIGPICASKF